MEQSNSQNALIKVIFVLASIILLGLLSVGVVQTFVHNGLIAKQAELEAQNATIEQDIETAQEEIDIRESNEYLDDFLEQEQGYGNDGEVIYQP